LTKKTKVFVGLWAFLGAFMVLLANWWLVLGVVVGLVARLYSGHVISVATGLVLGILVAEALKFLAYKL
jgi:hypothetical protein